VAAPIVLENGGAALGAVLVAPQRDADPTVDALPAAEAIAAEVGLALRSATARQQGRAFERIARELAAASRIQAGFLPASVPVVPGWRIAALLEPAREMSGDFYDFIALPGGRIGFLVADVADKGLPAALYMALCRTLLRTFAVEFGANPELVLSSTSRRLLQDTHDNWFVTAFYGILDPIEGALVYANAGHTPAVIVPGASSRCTQRLGPTGTALGVLADATWLQASVSVRSGDALVLVSDGITEATDSSRKRPIAAARYLARRALSRPPSGGYSASTVGRPVPRRSRARLRRQSGNSWAASRKPMTSR
jgi:sigma-B regulation protein RsbU (phosphoserine phosphatase)